MTKVSVVIPTYKRNDFLERAIKSVLQQSFQDFEIIIVDDNGIGNQFRKKNRLLQSKYNDYNNIHFIFPDKNIGGSLARNIGIGRAKGKYIAFLDDDDFFYPMRLEKVMRIAEMSDEKASMFYTWAKSSNGKEYCNIYGGTSALFDLFKDDYLAATSQWVILRSALIGVSGFDDTPAKQDSIMTFKLLDAGYTVKCVPEILSEYTEHDGVRISNSGSTIMGEKNLYQRYLAVRHKFSEDQIKIIEFSFTWRFFKYNVKSRHYYSAILLFLKLQRINFRKSWIELVRKLKHIQ